jgi:hypothetical protein
MVLPMKKALTIQEFASMGGTASAKRLTKAERVAKAKKAAAARWGKERKAS